MFCSFIFNRYHCQSFITHERFDKLQVAEAPFNSIAYRSDRQTFVMIAPRPLSDLLKSPWLFLNPVSNLCCIQVICNIPSAGLTIVANVAIAAGPAFFWAPRSSAINLLDYNSLYIRYISISEISILLNLP